MMVLPQKKCRALLDTLVGHPRVTFGKNTPADIAKLLLTLPTYDAPAASDGDFEGTHCAADPVCGRFTLTLEGSLNQLSARLQCAYGDRMVTVGLTSETAPFSNMHNPSRVGTRDFPAEYNALNRLTSHGFTGPDTSGHFTLKREHAILSFFAQELPRMQREWKVSIGARFSHITETIERIVPRIDIRSSGESWFDLDVSLTTLSGETFSRAEIQRLLQTGQNHVRLKNNRLAVFDGGMLDELQNVLLDANPQQVRPGTYRINRAQAGYVDAAISQHAQISGASDWQTWTRAQRRLEKPKPISLGSLEDVLRPYQKEGVYWMNFLAQNGLAGILADEMGLGKTLQALAFLRSLCGKGAASLVVCPSSLIHNWRREIDRFAPELRLLVIEGAGRADNFASIRGVDIVITSYPLLRRDIKKYCGISFAAVVLDEAQHIKNPETQNAQAAAALCAKHRFVLTGTPIENSVRDLWSIMRFLMPGYLGTREDFQERYEQPVSKENAPVQNRLTQRLKPFLLRRLKRNVATDLPEKLEQILYCELTAQQREIYTALLETSRKQIHEFAGEKDRNKGRMLILTVLLRLRQACCDLRLLNLPNLKSGETSGKLGLLDELLRECIDGGHRVLIFSQFVTMLQLLREQLEGTETKFCYLDGQTKERMNIVDRFQNDTTIPVFLISLKAGGVGINLTAADTVIHFDPWWNPAVEAQATDRTHRIGQKNIVTSYKLIAKGTVEEKILNLQLTKRNILGSVLSEENSLIPNFMIEEIESLLS